MNAEAVIDVLDAQKSLVLADAPPLEPEPPLETVVPRFVVPEMLEPSGYRRSATCPLEFPMTEEHIISFCHTTRTFTYTPVTQKISFASVAAKHIAPSAAARKEKERAAHVEKLRTDPEYALSYAKSGERRKPPPRPALTTSYITGLKKIPRNELRIVLRGMGVDCTKVQDISFIGRAIIVLTVDAPYTPTLHTRLKEKDITVLEDFDPTKSDSCKSYESSTDMENQALKRTVKRLCTEAAQARSRDRRYLADYFLRQSAEFLARTKFHGDALEIEIAALLEQYGKTGFVMDQYLATPINSSY